MFLATHKHTLQSLVGLPHYMVAAGLGTASSSNLLDLSGYAITYLEMSLLGQHSLPCGGTVASTPGNTCAERNGTSLSGVVKRTWR